MRRARTGFTLLEVLVALALFGVIAVVLGGAYLNGLNAYEVAAQGPRVDADVRFARQMLMEQPDLALAEQGDDFQTIDGRTLTWTAEIQPTNVADLFDVIFTCEIRGGEAKEDRVVEQRFRLLRPTWSEGSEREELRTEARDRILEALGRTP